MDIFFVGRGKLLKTTLPDVVRGTYWIKDGDKKIVNIEARKDKWAILSDKNMQVTSENIMEYSTKLANIPYKFKIIKGVYLKEYSMYKISIDGDDEKYTLIVCPTYEKNFIKKHVSPNASNITIGKSSSNDIVYENILMEDRHAELVKDEEGWKIITKEEIDTVFVNNELVEGEKRVGNGDIIFIMGLKIIVMGDYLYINEFENKVKFSEYLETDKKKIKIENEAALDVDSNKEVEIYSEKDYFSRSPKVIEKIEVEEVKIDNPPSAPNQQDMPAVLAMGSSLSMSAMMMVSGYTAIDGLINKTASLKQSITALITSGAMLIGMIVMPFITRGYQKNEKKKYEKKRQLRYKKYINSKIVLINEIMEKQNKILNEDYPSLEKCQAIILNHDSRLWERKSEDSNFLTIRAGTGNIPLEIKVQYPDEQFRMDDDNLIEILNSIGEKSKILENAPVTLSLLKKNLAGIISENNDEAIKYVKTLILQLIAMHNYLDLKIVVFVEKDNMEKWNFVRMLPHIWSNLKDIRFLSDNDVDMRDISRYLEMEFDQRMINKQRDSKVYTPYYLIITDNYKRVENIKIVSEVVKSKVNLGFGLLCLSKDFITLPDECATFISLDGTKGNILEIEDNSSEQREFTIDTIEKFKFQEISEIIGNIPIRFAVTGDNALPKKYTFLQMYDVGKIEQLNILDRWNSNDTTKTLKADIGSDGSKDNIVLDVHEKYHGPHGLIAGSTGSGKSEFIITYILSLAINYHPDDVNFVLIDYKGGGLAGAFQKSDMKLPHVVGTITNIDKNGLQRSLDSIQSELRKRQIKFNEARELSGESTIDIYKYQKMYHEGTVKEPISHLFIICDEFAELKQQQPDFMDELMSVSRIGRSLGVHLILATQKPAGIVNDQIRSNSKFGICLKVQDKMDSMDVIKKPNAAFLKSAGQFYMNVGNDDYFVLGQSGWSGAPYEPTNIVKKAVDTAIDFIDDSGMIVKKYNNDVKVEVKVDLGDQLTNIVKYICDLADKEHIDEGQLWLPEIPENIYVRDVRKKYNIKDKLNDITAIVGEYDDPFNQEQGPVKISLSTGGNLLVYGSADSGKDELVSSLIFDIITNHSTEEVQIYALDFGSETLKIYKDAPQVGDVILVNDQEKVNRLMGIIEGEIRHRKQILAEYNGDYNFFIKNSGKSMPLDVFIIHNYAVFTENYEAYEARLQTITRDCVKCGIKFIITANSYNEIRYRLGQNFEQKLVLQLIKDDDYIYLFDKIGKKRPSKIKGRGLLQINKSILEFQTAKVYKDEKVTTYIKEVIEKLKTTDKYRAKEIPVLPDFVKYEDVISKLKGTESIPVGIETTSLSIATVNYSKSHINIVTGKLSNDVFDFAVSMTTEIVHGIKDAVVFDMEKVLDADIDFSKQYEILKKIADSEEINDRKLCLIIGLEEFANKLPNGKTELSELIKNTEKNCNFVIFENAMKFKDFQYEAWYKEFITGDTGIWIGDGIDTQYLLTVNATRSAMKPNCGKTFGYIIIRSAISLVKLVGVKGGDANGQ